LKCSVDRPFSRRAALRSGEWPPIVEAPFKELNGGNAADGAVTALVVARGPFEQIAADRGDIASDIPYIAVGGIGPDIGPGAGPGGMRPGAGPGTAPGVSPGIEPGIAPGAKAWGGTGCRTPGCCHCSDAFGYTAACGSGIRTGGRPWLVISVSDEMSLRVSLCVSDIL
jgi:hypothetical protein